MVPPDRQPRAAARLPLLIDAERAVHEPVEPAVLVGDPVLHVPVGEPVEAAGQSK